MLGNIVKMVKTVNAAVLVAKIALFVGYLVVSIWMLVKIFDQKGCFVRQSYHQQSLSSFVSSDMYTGTQIVRPPPRSRVEVLSYRAVPDKQKMSDLGAFPTIVSDPVKDAAFWPVHVQPDANLNEIFQNRQAVNFTATIAALIGEDPGRALAHALNGTLFSQNKSLLQGLEGTQYYPIVENLLGHLNTFSAGMTSSLYTSVGSGMMDSPLDLFDQYSRYTHAWNMP